LACVTAKKNWCHAVKPAKKTREQHTSTGSNTAAAGGAGSVERRPPFWRELYLKDGGAEGKALAGRDLRRLIRVQALGGAACSAGTSNIFVYQHCT
jgi:hypothetical protein